MENLFSFEYRSPPRNEFFYKESNKKALAYIPAANTIYRWFYFWKYEFK